MKLWLAQRFGRAGKMSSATPGHASGKAMSIGSLEHIVRNRVRTFLRHTWLVTILGTIILAGGVWLAVYYTTQASVMKIAAGPAGGVDPRLVQILAEKFEHDGDKIDLQLVTTSGPAQSAHAITDGEADLAILPGNIGRSPDWPVVAILRQNVMAFIVPAAAPNASGKKEASTPGKKETSAPEKKETPEKKKKNSKSDKSAKDTKNDKTAKNDKSAKAEDADSTEDTGDAAAAGAAGGKLEKVRQLSGRRIGIVTGNEASADLLNVVLRHYGVPLDKVQISQIDPTSLANAIRDNKVDVIFVAGPATGHAITDAVTAAANNGEAPTFIPIDQAEGIAKRDPAFDSIDIDAGTFGGNPPSPDASLKSLSFPEYLVARKSFSHERIATLAKLIYSSRLALAADMPGEVKIEAPSTDKDAGVIVHPGAHAYLTDDQKSFFDKYGDEIFYGLLIFPLFGSTIAAAAGYFRHSGRTRRLRLLQRLLDLVRKAHAAPSLEALDQIQLDVDNLVVALIHQSEHEEYDQTVKMSFSLALDQVRFAIAARRAVLLDQVGTETKAGTKAVAA
jgi:TRAP-type uncharacterized transport system substrate-binding protein